MKPSMRHWAGIGFLILLTPVGWLARQPAFGEWASHELARRTGFVPEGLKRLEILWSAACSGYTLPGWTQSWLGYLCSALLGVGVVAGLTAACGRWLVGRKPGGGA